MLRGAAGTALALALSGCGAVRLGGPAEYTPPPPGIDDLYRTDLLALLVRARAGTERLQAASGADEAVADVLAALAEALPVQRTALLTGAEQEREAEADPGTEGAAPVDAPEDLPALAELLHGLRDLAADAARQVSGSLARPVAAISAHTAWAVVRLHAAAPEQLGEVPPAPGVQDLVPTREVPETDPPSIGATEDYHSALERAQAEEWYAGYAHEVLAARTEDAAREAHLALSDLHRDRATELGTFAEEDGAEVVPRQAVYALPAGSLAADAIGALPLTLSRSLLVDHLALVGAAPFARRPLPIAAALAEAERLGTGLDRLPPLPSLTAEEPPAGD